MRDTVPPPTKTKMPQLRKVGGYGLPPELKGLAVAAMVSVVMILIYGVVWAYSTYIYQGDMFENKPSECKYAEDQPESPTEVVIKDGDKTIIVIVHDGTTVVQTKDANGRAISSIVTRY